MTDLRKSLAQLGLRAQGGIEAEVTGLAIDSRQVKQGTLFAALPGSAKHGASFIAGAIEAGAAAILTDAEGATQAAEALSGAKVAVVIADDARATLARAAALWFGPQPGTAIAVTGTNGKTSVSTFARQIWQLLGKKAINVGTTGVEGDWTYPLHHTTPDPITLQKVLAEAARAGVTHVAMEASSHGLDQRRLEGVLLAAGGFTNFTQDHLDYHKTFDAYFEAKAALFDRLLPDEAVAAINIDDPKGAELVARAEAHGQEVISVGRSETARLRLLGQRFDATGQDIRFSWQGETRQLRLELIGGFQAENVLLAAAMVIGAGEVPENVFAALPQLGTVRGRMQLAATRKNGAAVFVDFAHTPDAIVTALKAMRPHVFGRIIAIVGAGGDRDRTKRPLMGAAAAEHADIVIVTDDNPRTEEPSTIRAAVMAGVAEAGGSARALEVADRAEAILRGVDMLEAGDALMICGKGHESGQIIGEDILPFDDAEQASIAVAALEDLQ